MQEFMGEVEVRAAHNVLEACAQTDTIHKVVFTSSVTAVIWRDDLTNSTSSSSDFDERNWSDINLCKNLKVSKNNQFISLVVDYLIQFHLNYIHFPQLISYGTPYQRPSQRKQRGPWLWTED